MDGLSLGIPGAGGVSPGTHLCALYSGPAERDRLLLPFLDEGLRHGDKCLCLLDGVEPAAVRDRAAGAPGSLLSTRSAQLGVERVADVYLRWGRFSTEGVMGLVSESLDVVAGEGFALVRAAGEMAWTLPSAPDWDGLFVCESALNRMVDHVPAILMCLYDVSSFGAEMLVEVLRTHPKVLLDHAVTDNPHYLPPDAYLHRSGVAAGRRYPLVKVVGRGAGADPGWTSLTEAELRVAARVSRGTTNRGIAAELSLSPHTVDAHLKHIYLKLRIHSRVELTVLALEHRLPATQP